MAAILISASHQGLRQLRRYTGGDDKSGYAIHHGLSFPDVTNPGMLVGLGPLALSYIVEAGGSGYFRTRAAKPYLDKGKLHLVSGAPSFSYPIYAVFSANADEALIKQALDGVRTVAALDA